MTTSSDITVVGNLTADPELRYTTSGTALCGFSIAVNRRYKKGDEWQDDTSFIDCTLWRDQAENFAESAGKGDRLIVTGRIEQRSWETEDGSKRSKLELVVDEVGLSLRWATGTTTKIKKASTVDRDTPPPAAYEDSAEEPF